MDVASALVRAQGSCHSSGGAEKKKLKRPSQPVSGFPTCSRNRHLLLKVQGFSRQRLICCGLSVASGGSAQGYWWLSVAIQGYRRVLFVNGRWVSLPSAEENVRLDTGCRHLDPSSQLALNTFSPHHEILPFSCFFPRHTSCCARCSLLCNSSQLESTCAPDPSCAVLTLARLHSHPRQRCD